MTNYSLNCWEDLRCFQLPWSGWIGGAIPGFADAASSQCEFGASNDRQGLDIAI